ncbi:helix-turn-helix domain-containing protein [Paenibacillus silvisoli]|uniref:helix-turn-helix domain-containing protein n=1 Tax=Paenibacillus silvisoli TaxID=3110539 RepID=UPI0028064825|nr:helix-turn-helix transcriptional regulator [Paenibacillus silvisoli]
MTGIIDLGKKVSLLRRSSNMTQEELGRRLNVSAQAISKWENGDSFPDISLLTELATTFNCSTDYLLGCEGSLHALLPQIREAFANMKTEEKIAFFGELITAAESLHHPSTQSHPSLVHIHLAPSGMGLWAKDRLICLATASFLEEAIETSREEDTFPITILPDDVRCVLFALLRDIDNLAPDYAIEEKKLMSLLPDQKNAEQIMSECIELGFVDRVRGGYRLNHRADLVVRLLAIIHHTIKKQGLFNVVVGNRKEKS